MENGQLKSDIIIAFIHRVEESGGIYRELFYDNEKSRAYYFTALSKKMTVLALWQRLYE